MTNKHIWRWDGVGFVPGVPARDMTDSEWRSLTEDQRARLKPHYTKLTTKNITQPAKAEE